MDHQRLFPSKCLSQEQLKLLACLTMLSDHTAVILLPVLFPQTEFYQVFHELLRTVGRLAFPIYCFLTVEGIWHTHNLNKYAGRLATGALLAEIPFDLLFFGRLTFDHQSVMVTLLLGLLAICWGRKLKNYVLPFAVCFLAAEFLNTDYGGWGVAIICMFALTKEMPHKNWLQLAGLALIFWAMDSYRLPVGSIRIPIQLFGLAAMVPIALYTGKKVTYNRAVHEIFYLFYPVHMCVLLMLVRL